MALNPPPSDSQEPANPYTAPFAKLREPPEHDRTPAEAVRLSHLDQEAAIRAIGTLHLLIAYLGLFAVPVLIFGIPIGATREGRLAGLGILLVTVLNGALGFGLHLFQPWARWTEASAMTIGLLTSAVTFAVGKERGVYLAFVLVVQGYILYLLLSVKGTRIFSADYQEILQQTRHLKEKSGVGPLLGMLLFITLSVVLLFASLLGSTP